MRSYLPVICLLLFLSQLALNEAEAKPKWFHAETERFSVYSNAGKRETRNALQELNDAERILSALMPKLVRERQIPLRVIICRNAKTLNEFSPLYDGKPKQQAGFFSRDFEGPFLVIRTDSVDEITKHIIYHEYIHFLVRQPDQALPLWLNEGIAELFATVRRQKDGKVIVGEFLPQNVYYIAEEGPLPFSRFFSVGYFSPEYNSSKHGAGRFYAQSWAFLHYLMFGENDFDEKAYENVIARAFSGKAIDENFIQKTLGIDYETLEKRIRNYCRGGRYSLRTFQLDDDEDELEFDYRPMSDGEVDLLLGALVLTTRTPRDAYSYLGRASEKLTSNPQVAAYLGYHAWKQNQVDRAREELKRSLDLGNESPYCHLNYAKLLLRQKLGLDPIRENALSRNETVEILSALFKARQLAGSFDEQLYQAIGETWLSSIVAAEDEHMAVLIEGINAYPTDVRIPFYLACYYTKNGDLESARMLVDRHYPNGVSGPTRASYEFLDRKITRLEKLSKNQKSKP